MQPMETLLQFLFVRPVVGVDRHVDLDFRKRDQRQAHRMLPGRQRVVRMRVAELRDAADVAGVKALDLDAVLALRDGQVVELLHSASRGVV